MTSQRNNDVRERLGRPVPRCGRLPLLAVMSLLATVLLTAAAGNSFAAADYSRLKDEVSQLIRKEMRSNDVVGLSIALVDDQNIVWAQGFGHADREKHRPANGETIYRIGSITKLFTVAAALQLVEQGKLGLDQPLRLYLPEFSIHSRSSGSGAQEITLRHLMTHHAGLPSNIQKGMWSSKPESYQAVLDLLRDEYTAYPPGTIFSYSNVGATLLGLALERAVGIDYASQVRLALLQPLGMERSGFIPRQSSNGLHSRSYHKGRDVDDPQLREVPAGGLSASVLDLGRFMEMIFANGSANGRRILAPETIAEMLRPQNLNVPLDLGMRVGLGWMLGGFGEIDIQNAGPVAHHAGATILFHSQMVLLPEHKLGVVVLANSSASGKVVNKAAARTLVLALEAKAGIKQPELKKPQESNTDLSPAVRRDYSGRYASFAGLVGISARSDHFHAEAMNRTFQLVPHLDGWYGIKYRILGLIPLSLGELDYYELSHALVAGHEILKVRTKGRELLVAEKLRTMPLPEAWVKRTGEYSITNLGDDFPLLEMLMLRVDDGLLVAEVEVPFFFKGSARFPLIPVSDTEAVTAGLGRGMGETVRVVALNGREALRYSGYVLVRKNNGAR